MGELIIRTTNGELYHHGIKGQKWGVRNGDNYPLNPSEHSSAEKKAANLKSAKAEYKAAKKAYNKSYRKLTNGGAFIRSKKKNDKINAQVVKDAKNLEKAEDKYKKVKESLKTDEKFNSSKLTDKQKKAIKVGAAVAGTLLVTYGAYKLSKLNKEATKGLQKKDFDLADLNFRREQANREIASQMADHARKTGSSLDIANKNLKYATEAHNRGVERLKRAKLGKYSLKDKYKYLKNG